MTTPSPNPPPSAHVQPGDEEEIYFEGSPPVRSEMGRLLLFVLITLALAAVGVFLLMQHIGPMWVGIVLMLLALLLPAMPVLLLRTIRYRVSNYRIDYERGFFTKSIDTLELWHVEDLHFEQSLLHRILNVGTITVLSHDETMPKLQLWGLPNPRPLYETLKQRVIAVKRQRGVIKMDPG